MAIVAEGQSRDSFGDALPAGAIARIGKLRHQHDAEGACTALAVFPDGKQVVSVLLSERGTKASWHLWDADGRHVFQAPLRDESVQSIAISPRGDRLALLVGPDEERIDGDSRAVARYEIEFWDVPARKKLDTVVLGERRVNAVLLPDSEAIRTVEVVKRSIEIRDARKKTLVRSWQAPGNEIERLSASADGRFLTVTAPNGPVRIFDATGKLLGEAPYPGRPNKFRPVTQGWHKDGVSIAATVDIAGSVLRAGKEEWELRRTGYDHLTSVAFAPDGKTLFAGMHSGAITQWDCATGQECTDPDRPRAGVDSVSLSPGARFVAAGNRNAPNGLRVWEVAKGKLVQEEDTDSYSEHAFSVDGKFAYITRQRLFLTATPGLSKPRELEKPTRHQLRLLAFAPDGKMLYLVTPDGVNRWTVNDGKQVPIVNSFKLWTRYLEFSPDGQGIVLERENKIVSAEAATGKEISVLFDVGLSAEKRSAGWSSFQFVSNTQLLVAMSQQSAMRLLDLPSGKVRHAWEWECEFSDRRCGLSPINSGAIAVLPHGQSAVIVPDGGQAAILKTDNVARRSNLIRLVDLATGGIRVELDPRQGNHIHLSLSPDGRFLASGGRDGTVLIWDLYAKPPGLAPTLDKCWQALEGHDASAVHLALCALVDQPDRAVAFLKRKLEPAGPRTESSVVRKWIAALESTDFKTRQSANAALKKLHRQAADELRRARPKASSLEAQRRIDLLLADCEIDPPELVRVKRALEALEMMQHPAAHRFLESLSRGAADVFPTPEARLAIERIGRHGLGRP
jgi:WD40 repeat protein